MKITIVGCGNMGSAIAKRLSQYHQLFLCDHNPEKAQNLQKVGHGIASQYKESLQQSDAVILAIKPSGLKEAAKEIASHLKQDHLIISILAGTSIRTLRKFFPSHPLVRMMPNMALLYGEGLIALAADAKIDESAKQEIADFCKPFGKVFWLPESHMDAFTSLASSGPAFMFAIIEAMIEAGLQMGLSAEEAKKIVHNMIKGSLVAWEKSGKQLDELKSQIASPNGTTVAGLKKMEEKSIHDGIVSTFIAAFERAQQMEKGQRTNPLWSENNC